MTIPEEIRNMFEVRDGEDVFCRIRVVLKEGGVVNSKQAKNH